MALIHFNWCLYVFAYTAFFLVVGTLILGSDHGIKAQGDGWLLTVALIEGTNLATVDSSGCCDPYVVFTCNGKTRTSSIKFKKSDPLWNGEFRIIYHLVVLITQI